MVFNGVRHHLCPTDIDLAFRVYKDSKRSTTPYTTRRLAALCRFPPHSSFFTLDMSLLKDICQIRWFGNCNEYGLKSRVFSDALDGLDVEGLRHTEDRVER